MAKKKQEAKILTVENENGVVFKIGQKVYGYDSMPFIIDSFSTRDRYIMAVWKGREDRRDNIDYITSKKKKS